MTTETADARNISCQGLALNVDPDVLTFHGKPVTNYAEEWARRGEGHIYGCDLVGHIPDPDGPHITHQQVLDAIAALGLTDRVNDITEVRMTPHEVWIVEQVRDEDGKVRIGSDGTPNKRSTCIFTNHP
jgi:hypothetical protein